jgi:hypothetical protein
MALSWSHGEVAGENMWRQTPMSILEDILLPSPTTSTGPTAYSDDARFVKADPLELPMGVADLRQPRLRSDFISIEWLQHLFRYYTGQFLSSNRGHRFAFVAFNTVWLELSHLIGHLAHR